MVPPSTQTEKTFRVPEGQGVGKEFLVRAEAIAGVAMLAVDKEHANALSPGGRTEPATYLRNAGQNLFPRKTASDHVTQQKRLSATNSRMHSTCVMFSRVCVCACRCTFVRTSSCDTELPHAL